MFLHKAYFFQNLELSSSWPVLSLAVLALYNPGMLDVPVSSYQDIRSQKKGHDVDA